MIAWRRSEDDNQLNTESNLTTGNESYNRPTFAESLKLHEKVHRGPFLNFSPIKTRRATNIPLEEANYYPHVVEKLKPYGPVESVSLDLLKESHTTLF